MFVYLYTRIYIYIYTSMHMNLYGVYIYIYIWYDMNWYVQHQKAHAIHQWSFQSVVRRKIKALFELIDADGSGQISSEAPCGLALW